MERALSLAEEPEVVADIWYNLGHIGINLGENTVKLWKKFEKLVTLLIMSLKLGRNYFS